MCPVVMHAEFQQTELYLRLHLSWIKPTIPRLKHNRYATLGYLHFKDPVPFRNTGSVGGTSG